MDKVEILPDKTNKDAKKKEKQPKQQKEKTPRMFSTKLMITLLSVAAAWLLATALFVVLKLTLNKNFFMCFMWAGVLSGIVLIVFNSIWGKMRYLFVILTILLWLTLASIHIQLLVDTPYNIWPVYFLGIPLQISIILWGALVKKPKGYYKKESKPEETPIEEQE